MGDLSVLGFSFGVSVHTGRHGARQLWIGLPDRAAKRNYRDLWLGPRFCLTIAASYIPPGRDQVRRREEAAAKPAPAHARNGRFFDGKAFISARAAEGSHASGIFAAFVEPQPGRYEVHLVNDTDAFFRRVEITTGEYTERGDIVGDSSLITLEPGLLPFRSFRPLYEGEVQELAVGSWWHVDLYVDEGKRCEPYWFRISPDALLGEPLELPIIEQRGRRIALERRS